MTPNHGPWFGPPGWKRQLGSGIREVGSLMVASEVGV